MKRSERTTLCESALKIRMFESQLKRKFELKWQKRQIEKLVSWTLPCWAALVLVIMLQSVADGQHLDNLDSRLLLWPASNLYQLVDNVWMRNTDVAKLVSLLFRSSAACRAEGNDAASFNIHVHCTALRNFWSHWFIFGLLGYSFDIWKHVSFLTSWPSADFRSNKRICTLFLVCSAMTAWSSQGCEQLQLDGDGWGQLSSIFDFLALLEEWSLCKGLHTFSVVMSSLTQGSPAHSLVGDRWGQLGFHL